MFATKLAEIRAEEQGIPKWKFLLEGTGVQGKITCADVARVKRKYDKEPKWISYSAIKIADNFNIKLEKLKELNKTKPIILKNDVLNLIECSNN
jgi:hypothetical protein